MGFEGLKFGAGPKELGGSVDLISHYKLWPHHEFFCKKSLPLSISETPYLHNVVGDREIRKGDGMELDQLYQDVALLRQENRCIHPFRLDVLANIFHIRETTAVRLSSPDRGTPTAVTKLEKMSKERHHKKDKIKGKRKSKDLVKHRHRTKDKHNNEVTQTNKYGSQNNGPNHSKSQEKKRRRDESQYLPCISARIK